MNHMNAFDLQDSNNTRTKDIPIQQYKRLLSNRKFFG
jgi:hypothetical protein